MHKWHQKAGAILALAAILSNGPIVVSTPAYSQGIEEFQGGTYCGIDRNFDGSYDGEGEIANCDNGVCPLDAQECLTNRVHQVCDEDTTEISCAPDEEIEVCEPDTTTRQCDPDTTHQVCEPDQEVEVCDPDTVEEVCDPDTRERVCETNRVRVCETDRVQVCETDRVRVCETDRVRVCENVTTRVCENETTCRDGGTERVCDPDTTREVCGDRPITGYSCPTIAGYVLVRNSCNQNTGSGACMYRSKHRRQTTSRSCSADYGPRECHTETVPGECRTVDLPDVCETNRVCRNETERVCHWENQQSCHWEDQQSCHWEDQQSCHWENQQECRWVTTPGECRDVVRPGECRTEIVPGECQIETVPGECRDVVIPGECTTQTVPGECNEITVPGECRDEPLPDECPLEGVDECHVGSDGVSRCSDTVCVNTSDFPIEDVSAERVSYQDDGQYDASGECLNDVQVFAGQGNDCQKPGLLTLFKDCCKNRGEVIYDGGGGGIATTAATVAIVFTGAKAAFGAFKAGATAAAAADAGMTAIAGLANPVTIAAGVAILLFDLLNLGCTSEDMETGMLDGSGMCHFIGTYCVAKIPFIGCIQKAKAHCCFNSKLGRIIHEQGRSQLKAFDGWGEPKDPICRGFTPAEFQALNFSDIDLSEYYGELETATEGQLQSMFESGLESYINAGEVPDGD